MNKIDFYKQAPTTYFESQNASLAVRTFGKGPALVFLHGFPTSGYTWRHILPELSKKYTCHVLDMPGLGDSQWKKNSDFHFRIQTKRVIEFINSLKVESCSIIAHDTGATTARFVALDKSLIIDKLFIINTEMPGHRPPWIPLYQFLSKLLLSHFAFRASLSIGLFVRSPMGFRAFYADKKLLKVPTNLSPYLQPLTSSNHRIKGAFAYLRGCDLKYMDTLKERHKDIDAKVLLIWGEEDVTFPIQYAEEMTSQFKNAQFFRLKNAALMPHEEQPENVVEIILN